MANKILSTRQKLTFRVEPSQRNLKPRNPIAMAAKQRAAGAHGKTASALRQRLQQMLKKKLSESDGD